MKKNSLAVLEAREEPDVTLILRELRDAVNGAQALGIFEKLETCHNTRRCWWQGQQADGRLPKPEKSDPSRNLYWWEGAPEPRHHKADTIVVENAGVRELVMHRGQVMVSPGLKARSTVSPDDDAEAEGWQLVLEAFRQHTERDLDYEWALHCSCVEELGYSIIGGSWTSRLRNARKEVSRAELNAVVVRRVHRALLQSLMDAGEFPEMPLEEAEQQPLPEEMLQRVAETADEAVVSLLSDLTGQTALPDLLTLDPAISPAEARRVVKALNDGEAAEYYAPEDDGGVPEVRTLIPWVHVIHPMGMNGRGQTDMFAEPEWVSEATLRQRAATEGWKADFVEKVLQHANVMMPELQNFTGASWALNGAGIGLTLDLRNAGLWELPLYQIMTVKRRAVNAQGLPMIFRTVVHPLVNDAYGIHECTRLRTLPFLVETREPVALAVLSRGVGQIVVAAQNQVLDLMKGEGARAQLGSNPPLQRQSKEHVPVRPGMQLYGRFVGADKGNEFLATPPVDMGALKLIDLHEQFINERFFRGPLVNPDTRAQQQELLAHRARKTLAALVKLMGELVRAHLTPEALAAIAGRTVNPRMLDSADVQVGFNVTGLSADSSTEWLEFLKSLAALDRGGRVDWGAVVEDSIMARNPAMAKRLVLSNEEASERALSDQETRIAKIMAGVPVRYEKRASTPEARLQVLDAWKQVPGNLEAVSQDQVRGEMMQKEEEYLQLQIQQYQENALIGRTLVKPNS